MIKDKFGIKLKNGTAKIEKIDQTGLFFKLGLKYDPNKVSFDLKSKSYSTEDRDRLTKWVITEINGHFLSYHSTAKEVSYLVNNDIIVNLTNLLLPI